MMKYITICCALAFSFCINAQISHGGEPMASSEQLSTKSIELSVNLLKSYALVQTLDDERQQPLRFAEPIFTNFTPENSGSWTESAGGLNIWTISIKSEGAKSLNLIFDKFYLNEGDKMFVYNKDRTQVLGAFTHENNKPSKLFAVAPVAGDEIVVELQTNYPINYNHEIQISAVNHDYLGVFGLLKQQSDFGRSGYCNVGVACEPIASDEVRRASCKIISAGVYLCSGTIINSTDETGNPMFLTAGHCTTTGWPEGKQFDYTAQTVIFFFNYESFSCDPVINGTDAQTVSGASLLAYVENMDFALLRMGETPKESYRPYFAGWTRAETIEETVFSVHHPYGDVKKIAISTGAPEARTFNSTSYGGVPFVEEAHWKITKWATGVTEPGSSGSGLFTQDQLLIGTLSGGGAVCSNKVEGIDDDEYYARFNKAWNKDRAKDESLAKWLSPDNLDLQSLQGREMSSHVRLTHLNSERTAKVLYDDNFKGSWSGHNERGYTAYANSFYDVESASISGIYIVPSKVSNSTQKINIKIWDNDNGVPGTVLWSKDNVALQDLRKDTETLYNLPTPLEVTGSFFAGVELNYAASIDTFSLYMSDIRNEEGYNRAFIRQDNGEWAQFQELNTDYSKGAYWIDVLVSDPQIVDVPDVPTGVKENRLTIVNNPVATNLLKYTSNINGLELAEVFAVNGAKVAQTKLYGKSSGDISVANIPQGLYLIRFTSSKQTIVKRVIITD